MLFAAMLDTGRIQQLSLAWQRGAVRSGPCSAPFRAPSKPLTMGPPCVETCPPYGCGSPHASDKARIRPLKIRLLSIPVVTFPGRYA